MESADPSNMVTSPGRRADFEAYGLSPEEAESPQPGTLLDDILARAVPIS